MNLLNIIPKNILRLTFFVTGHCNFNCIHCFYSGYKSKNELTLGNINDVFKSVGKHIRILTLSGGEPFFRDDISDIARSAFKLMPRLKYVNVVSNGSFPERVKKFSEFMIQRRSKLGIQFSLYGFRATHNRITNAESFDKIIELLDFYKNLKSAKVKVSVMTVLIDQTKQELLELRDFIKNKYPNIIHKFQVQRAASFVRECSIEQSDVTYRAAVQWQKQDIIGFLKEINRQPITNNMVYRLRQKFLRNMLVRFLEGKPYHFNCAMGKISAVLHSDGTVPICEYAAGRFNVKDYGFDLNALWHSPEFRRESDKIAHSYCYHPCALTDSLLFNASLLKRLLI